jgi:hypothetical protein
VSSDGDFDVAFSTMAGQRIRALFVSGNPYFISRLDKLISLAARHRIPAMLGANSPRQAA